MKIHKVFAVYANADMTEGRGPMVLDSLWWTEEGAWEYANRQRGVMGRSPFRDHAELREKYPSFVHKWQGDCTGWSCRACHPFTGDWSVQPMDIN